MTWMKHPEHGFTQVEHRRLVDRLQKEDGWTICDPPGSKKTPDDAASGKVAKGEKGANALA